MNKGKIYNEGRLSEDEFYDLAHSLARKIIDETINPVFRSLPDEGDAHALIGAVTAMIGASGVVADSQCISDQAKIEVISKAMAALASQARAKLSNSKHNCELN